MNSTSALGFLDTVSDTALFLESAKRALDIIFTDKTVTRRVSIHTLRPELLRLIPEYCHCGGESSMAWKLKCRAYSFTTVGTGSYTVFEGGKSKTVNFSGTRHHRHLANEGEVILTFYGECAFTVRDIAAYSAPISKNEENVPLFEELFSIDIKKELNDYQSLWGDVTDKYGIPKSAYEKDGVIYTAAAESGICNLTYRRKAPDIEHLSLDAALDIPPECEALLPLLTAAIILLDDDADKAQYYMALYRDLLDRQTQNGTGLGSARYLTNGWA